MQAETFRSAVVPAGNATGAEVPAEVVVHSARRSDQRSRSTINDIEAARAAPTRQRRIERLVESLR